MPQKQIAIFTVEDDLHALAIQSALMSLSDTDCRIVETNRICAAGLLNWSDVEGSAATLPSIGGAPLDVTKLDAIWWRRVNVSQRLPPSIVDPAHIALINNDTRAALRGLLLTEFSGVWISAPQATELADNKLIQLRAAKLAGFRIPQTLVSQDPTRIREFCQKLHYEVVVKPVYGAREARVVTTMVTERGLTCNEGIKLCPAIYQELIPGKEHLRVSCFGESLHAALIESDNLDWRTNYDAPMRRWDVPEKLRFKIRKVLDILGLKMGIIDLKLGHTGDPVWLEVNAQGQFLFVEALCDLDLTARFAEFLYREADRVSRRHRRPSMK